MKHILTEHGLKGKEFKCLDKGFVRLVDVMPSVVEDHEAVSVDNAIVQAARTSYGEGTKTVNEDRELIRYLMRHEHLSPIEQVELKFHAKLPMFVARQWVRHRTACIAAEVKISLIDQNYQVKNKQVKHVYDDFRSGEDINVSIVVYDDQWGDITESKIKDIWESGIKPVYLYTFENGYSIKCTDDHEFITSSGKVKARDLSSDITVNTVNYKDNSVHQTKLMTSEFVGEEMTYDLEVEHSSHNFIANGIVVSNSLNEISGRYSIIKEEFYLPELERIQKQAKNNKQGSGEELPLEEQQKIRNSMNEEQSEVSENYQRYLANDVARELARIDLPLSTYTEWYWKIDLRNLLHFLHLRMDSHAQYEIRVYAEQIYEILKLIAPMTVEAFEDYVLKGRNFSRMELELLLENIDIDLLKEAVHKSTSLDKLEKLEFINKL